MNERTKVLLVEDEANERELIAYRLAGHCQLTTVAGIVEAIAALTQTDYDVMLLDVGLPDSLNDLDSLRRMKSARRNAAIVILSGNDDPTFMRDAIRDSANGYLVKGRQDRTARAIAAEIDRAIENHITVNSLK